MRRSVPTTIPVKSISDRPSVCGPLTVATQPLHGVWVIMVAQPLRRAFGAARLI